MLGTIVRRYCVCQKNIPDRQKLCRECNEKYGPPEGWPEWLRFYIRDVWREVQAERAYQNRRVSSG